MKVDEAILKTLAVHGGSVTVRSALELRRMIPASKYRTNEVLDGVRRCRNSGQIRLKTRNGVTHMRLRLV